MKKLENKKVAIICDWLKDFGWAEIVISHLMEIFPNADIFSSVFFMGENKIFLNKNIKTSFIQKIPFLNKSHKLALTLRGVAFESFDLSKYDIVISSSSAESKWIITKPDTIHFCYCHTPTRYFWSHYHEYIKMLEFWILNPLAKYLIPKIINKLRLWDYVASQRVDYFIANSLNTKNRILKYYNKNSEVIYPWIDIERIPFSEEKWDYYFYNWRCVPYKKFDLIVEAFNKNWKKIIIETNTDNKLYRKLKKISNPNIIWKFNLSKDELNNLLSKARWFIFPVDEDFWLAPIFAMATWTPVIALKSGWALETIIDWKTWIFFENQNIRWLNNALEKFETMEFDAKYIKNHSLNFDKKIFQQKIIDFIENKI